jgi:hypothetical protein
MTGRRLKAVGEPESAPLGNPEVIAQLRDLLFRAQSGEITGFICLIETPTAYDSVEANDWCSTIKLGLFERQKYIVLTDELDEDEDA